MSNSNTARLKLCYMDGTEQQFEYVRPEEVQSLSSRIQEALKLNQVLIEVDDRLLVIPMQNLKAIEISPVPQKLPNFVIRNARLIGS
jgi:hypothetical protein